MIVFNQEKAVLAAVQLQEHQPNISSATPLPNSEKSALLRGSTHRQRRTRFFRFSILTAFVFVVLISSFSPYHFLPGFSFNRPPSHHGPPGGGHHPFRPHRPLTIEQREKIFLSVPNPESALAASRAYATHPHLAGSPEDFEDAKDILKLFQSELGIKAPKDEPIFSAGTSASRNATLLLTTPHGPRKPSAWIDVYYPVMNTPKEHALHILGDDGKPVWEADLVEDGDPADEEAHKYRDAVPAWHGFSRDGDVSGHLVYANYGRKEDYDELVAQGVNFTDKIVIVRYGWIFRGLKVKGAQELGAAGVLIYSDPRDDGFVTVSNGYAPYPHGPARNPTSVQRGSVEYLSKYPGDPTTPGYPAYENAERQEGTNIPTIPSLPISWANAERLLEEIGSIYSGTDEEKRLSGNVSKAKIRLVNHVNTRVTPIWNTMGSIPGHIRDEVVLIGCHRDAWVMGAADPTSGTVSLHEIIRAFGALLNKGWKPLRTIVIASWDAEEYGLIGSTEWGEDFPSWISDHVVAYLNVDVSVAGSRFDTYASPSLAHLMKQAALEVPHPTIKGKTLWDAKQDQGPFKGEQTARIDSEFAKLSNETRRELHVAKTGVLPLGSGSDYTVFLQRLGVSSSDEGFAFTESDAVYHYHSIYDSQHWQEIYADPGFHRHVAIAKHLGLMGLRMTDSIVLPLNTTQYALELDDYLDKVESIADGYQLAPPTPDFIALRESIRRLQSASLKLDSEKVEAEEDFKKLLKKLPGSPRGHNFHRRDPMRKIKNWVKGVFGVATPTCEERRRLAVLRGHVRRWEDVLQYDLDELERDLSLYASDENKEEDFDLGRFEPDHGDYDRDFPPPGAHHPRFPIRKFIKAAKRVRKVNQKLIAFERGFISEGGIKDREWYKHLGVAPGKWLGYGATTFPALTEAITFENNATLAKYEAGRLVELLDKLSDVIKP